MVIVRAAAEHLVGIAAVRRSNGPAHDDSGVDPDYCRYLIDEGRLLVALQDGRVVGFGGAVEVGDARLLSDLHVHADERARGIGTALLRAVLAAAPQSFTFASDDPASLPLYARAGMLACWPLISMRGSAREVAAAGAVAYDLDIAHAAQFEQRVTGLDRAATFRYWAGRSASRTLGVDEGGLVAVAAVRVTDRVARIEHLVAEDRHAADAVRAVGDLVGRGEVHVHVPGCRPLFGDLVRAGFVIDGMQVLMATTPDLVPAGSQVVHPGLA